MPGCGGPPPSTAPPAPPIHDGLPGSLPGVDGGGGRRRLPGRRPAGGRPAAGLPQRVRPGAGPCPAGAPRPRRHCRPGGPGGDGGVARDGRRGPCGVHPHLRRRTEEDFARLRAALDAVAWGDGAPLPASAPPGERSHPSALFSPGFPSPLSAAEGRICAQVAPYPPGVPVFAPGERICKKTIAYLKQIGYNTLEDVEVVSEPVCAS
ncbi:MAG: hypothetical protein ACLRWQ_11750 [Flavonifractor plautii]